MMNCSKGHGLSAFCELSLHPFYSYSRMCFTMPANEYQVIMRISESIHQLQCFVRKSKSLMLVLWCGYTTWMCYGCPSARSWVPESWRCLKFVSLYPESSALSDNSTYFVCGCWMGTGWWIIKLKKFFYNSLEIEGDYLQIRPAV